MSVTASYLRNIIFGLKCFIEFQTRNRGPDDIKDICLNLGGRASQTIPGVVRAFGYNFELYGHADLNKYIILCLGFADDVELLDAQRQAAYYRLQRP